MRIYYGGAEVPSHRKLLAECGVKTVALSYVGLSRRVKFARPWAIEDHFPQDMQVFLDSGAYSINRKGEDAYTEEQIFDMAQKYMAFVTENIDRVSLVSEFDAISLGPDWVNGMREDFYDDLPDDKFLPIWHSDTGLEELERLVSRYARVGVLQVGDADQQLVTVLNAHSQRYGVKFHGVAMTKMEAMQEFRWDSVGSLSWLSPMMNGDTIIWTPQNKLIRYPKKYKDSSRSRHRSWLEKNGFDVAAIKEDDSHEVLRLSLWSWEHFVDAINGKAVLDPFGSVTKPTVDGDGQIPEEDGGPVDDSTPGSLNGELMTREPVNRETRLLPIMQSMVQTVRMPGDDGEEQQEIRTLEVSAKSLLACDNCFMKDKCPGYQPHHACAYEIPVEVHTMPQRAAVWDSMLAMQFQRVLRMQMVEQLEGGYVDQNLSAEIDRLARMLKARADTEKSGFSLHVEGSVQGDTGMLSRIFGKEAGTGMSALPAPERAQDIVEAEIISEETYES